MSLAWMARAFLFTSALCGSGVAFCPPLGCTTHVRQGLAHQQNPWGSFSGAAAQRPGGATGPAPDVPRSRRQLVLGCASSSSSSSSSSMPSDDGEGSDGGVDGERQSISESDNTRLYSELREREAVQHPGAGEETVLPSPDMSPQQVITTVLRAMKASPKRGCRVALRFMSGHSEHGNMTPADYEDMLRVGGQTAVLLGNFRSFRFPTPTFEQAGDGRRLAVQEVALHVPGFLASYLGASRGWDMTARLRWQLSRSEQGAWLTDEVEMLVTRDGGAAPPSA